MFRVLYHHNNSNNDLKFIHINKVVTDLTELCDIEIRVGSNQDTTILKARSLYFKTALSYDWMKKSENGI